MRPHSTVLRPISLTLIVAACLLSSSGCGSSERVVSVSGTVTHNGKPISGLVVSFVPDGVTETGVSSGETDENGKYSLKVAKSGSSGAVVGKHKVWVSLPREAPTDVDKEERAKKQKTKATTTTTKVPTDLAPILKTYGNPEKSPLTVEVKGGEPIDLKLD
jgi:hypothetical protein